MKGISSRQKGDIIENRISEIITLSSSGALTCYSPNSDDDGIDLIVNPRGMFNPLLIQIKSRFNLQKSGQFVQNVGATTFGVNAHFFLIFAYFNPEELELEKLWMVRSLEFQDIAYKKSAGKNYKSFYRFSANPRSTKDRWAKFSVDKNDLGSKLLTVIGGERYMMYPNIYEKDSISYIGAKKPKP